MKRRVRLTGRTPDERRTGNGRHGRRLGKRRPASVVPKGDASRTSEHAYASARAEVKRRDCADGQSQGRLKARPRPDAAMTTRPRPPFAHEYSTTNRTIRRRTFVDEYSWTNSRTIRRRIFTHEYSSANIRRRSFEHEYSQTNIRGRTPFDGEYSATNIRRRISAARCTARVALCSRVLHKITQIPARTSLRVSIGSVYVFRFKNGFTESASVQTRKRKER